MSHTWPIKKYILLGEGMMFGLYLLTMAITEKLTVDLLQVLSLLVQPPPLRFRSTVRCFLFEMPKYEQDTGFNFFARTKKVLVG